MAKPHSDAAALAPEPLTRGWRRTTGLQRAAPAFLAHQVRMVARRRHKKLKWAHDRGR